jgi:hypothetical protein
MNYRHVSCVPNVASVFRVSLTLTYTYIYLIIKTPELYMNEARYHLAMYHDKFDKSVCGLYDSCWLFCRPIIFNQINLLLTSFHWISLVFKVSCF